MKTLLFGLSILLFATLASAQQEKVAPQEQAPAPPSGLQVVLSDSTSTVRIAQPNEEVGINGHVLRVADVMAFLSSDSALVQHLHSLEKQNSSGSQQNQPAAKKGSKQSVSAPAMEQAHPAAEPPRKP
jgi:hypothetical protein